MSSPMLQALLRWDDARFDVHLGVESYNDPDLGAVITVPDGSLTARVEARCPVCRTKQTFRVTADPSCPGGCPAHYIDSVLLALLGAGWCGECDELMAEVSP